LNRHANEYGPQERLQLVVSAAAGDAERFHRDLSELTELVAGVRAERMADDPSPSEALLRTGQSFQIVGPALRALAEAGLVADAVAVLAAWAGVGGQEERAREPLLAVPAHPVGTLWAVEGASAPPIDEERNDLGAVIEAINAFLNMTILFRDDPAFVLHQPPRPSGMPMPEQGNHFVETCLAHLRLDGLRTLERPQDAMVVAPGQPLPFQALMLRELGWTLPINVSLRESRQGASLRRAVLIGDGQTSTSTWELDAVEAVLSAAGVQVTRVASDVASFSEAYSDPDVDVLWVASHAVFEAMQPERSAVHLAPGEEISLDDLAALTVPSRETSRLLMLSTCDAGMSAALGGLLGFGLGPAVAAPTQAVISHLWSAYPPTAAAFGVLLAAAVAGGASYLEAFSAATRALEGGSPAIEESLSALGDVAERLREHIALTSVPFDNVASWGSPALFV
jgi:CHAT domain-containing protein